MLVLPVGAGVTNSSAVGRMTHPSDALSRSGESANLTAASTTCDIATTQRYVTDPVLECSVDNACCKTTKKSGLLGRGGTDVISE